MVSSMEHADHSRRAEPPCLLGGRGISVTHDAKGPNPDAPIGTVLSLVP